MAERPATPTPVDARSRRRRAPELFTVKDVAEACGLAQPVVAQLVPRTWIDGVGWMYTAGQLQSAVEIGRSVRDGTYASTNDDLALSPCVRQLSVVRDVSSARLDE
ncbi:hypothetical protein MycrhDRAFT_5727 [Mycolicibacterium rhodesiae JS60]|nr:hypothetical protein MycrhDRAFT_5727 [Mycolicibacterium rhodesiae JS60]